MNLFHFSHKIHKVLDIILHNKLVKRLLPYLIILSLSLYIILYKNIKNNFITIDRKVFVELSGYAKKCNSHVTIVYRRYDTQLYEWGCQFYYYVLCNKDGSCKDISRDTHTPAHTRESCDNVLYDKMRELAHKKIFCQLIDKASVKKYYKNLEVYQKIEPKHDTIVKCSLFRDSLGQPLLIFTRAYDLDSTECSIEDDAKFSEYLIFNLFYKYLFDIMK